VVHLVESKDSVVSRQNRTAAIAEYGIDALFAEYPQDDIGSRHQFAGNGWWRQDFQGRVRISGHGWLAWKRAPTNVSGQNQKAVSLPTREQRMFFTSLRTIAQTGSPYKAASIQHFFDVLLDES
jgi:hypothetical protein